MWVKMMFFGVYVVLKGMDVDIYLDMVCFFVMCVLVDEGLIDVVDGFCEFIVFLFS